MGDSLNDVDISDETFNKMLFDSLSKSEKAKLKELGIDRDSNIRAAVDALNERKVDMSGILDILKKIGVGVGTGIVSGGTKVGSFLSGLWGGGSTAKNISRVRRTFLGQ